MDRELNCHCALQFGPKTRIEPKFQARAEPGRVTLIFGPSGSGKSTILRMLAGLIQPTEGEIYCGSTLWNRAGMKFSLPPQERKIGFLFQNYALFDHLTVRQNLGYGLRKLAPEERVNRVAEVARMLEITDLLDQNSRTLSGGQAQRTALGRSIATWPDWLFLDEPLSALDEPLRARLRRELRHLLKTIGIPAIIVTHDRREIESLGDDLLLMDAGKIIAAGPVREVLENPGSVQAARSLGQENIFPIQELTQTGKGQWRLRFANSAPISLQRDAFGTEGALPTHLSIPPEKIVFLGPGQRSPEKFFKLKTTLQNISKQGPLYHLECENPAGLVMQTTPQWLGFSPPAKGEALHLGVPLDSVSFLRGSHQGLNP